jgi:hypothetical protein
MKGSVFLKTKDGMKKQFLVWCLSLMMILLCVLSTMAADAILWRLKGKPEINKDVFGYYLWMDDKGLHVRTVSAGLPHYFNGRITTTYGSFTKVTNASKKMEDDAVRLVDERTVGFSYKTDTDNYGFDIVVEGYRPCIKFDLKVDHRRETSKVSLGEYATSPWSIPFTLCH